MNVFFDWLEIIQGIQYSVGTYAAKNCFIVHLIHYYVSLLFILESVSLIYKNKDAYANNNKSAKFPGHLTLIILKSTLVKKSVINLVNKLYDMYIWYIYLLNSLPYLLRYIATLKTFERIFLGIYRSSNLPSCFLMFISFSYHLVIFVSVGKYWKTSTTFYIFYLEVI